jgi:glutaredoxin
MRLVFSSLLICSSFCFSPTCFAVSFQPREHISVKTICNIHCNFQAHVVQHDTDFPGKPLLFLSPLGIRRTSIGNHCPLILNRIRGGVSMSQENPDDKNSVVFYTNPKCPYAQRVWITLEEKEVQYKTVEVALYGSGGKPSWFMALNPKGEVPVLKHGETVVVDSNQIIRPFPAGPCCRHKRGVHLHSKTTNFIPSFISPFSSLQVHRRQLRSPRLAPAH